MTDCTACGGALKARGEVRIAEYPNANQSRLIGNVAIFTRSISTAEDPIMDYTSEAGGICSDAKMIEDVTIQIDLKDAACPDNAALAMLGLKATVTAGTTITAEEHTSYHGSIVRTVSMPDPDTTIIVEDITDTTTYVLDTDYTVTKQGYVVPLSTGAITDGQVLHITYDTLGSVKVNALAGGFKKYIIFFDGVNVYTGKRLRSVVYKASLSATADASLISDNHITLSMTGRAENDSLNGGIPFQDEYYAA